MTGIPLVVELQSFIQEAKYEKTAIESGSTVLLNRPTPATAAGRSAKDEPESKRQEGCRTNARRLAYFGTSQPDWNFQVSQSQRGNSRNSHEMNQ